MVKATATMPDGRAVIVMGISEDNVKRLKDGQPIYFDPAALKIAPGTAVGAITLFYGRTDMDLARILHTAIGLETQVFTVPRSDERPT